MFLIIFWLLSDFGFDGVLVQQRGIFMALRKSAFFYLISLGLVVVGFVGTLTDQFLKGVFSEFLFPERWAA